MPCTFDAYERVNSPTWRSRDNRLTPASDWHFHVITGLRGGGCGHCRATQEGIAWGTDAYVLCLRCASAHFGAPDLHRYAPELFDDTASPPSEDDLYEDDPENLITKRDKDFDPRKYKVYTHDSPLSGRHGCSGYRCTTYTAPERTIPARAQFMLGEGSRGHLCMECFAKLKTRYDAQPARVHCPSCDRRTPEANMRPVVAWEHRQVCRTCLNEYFMMCPETDNGYVHRGLAVWAMTAPTDGTPQRRVYASNAYAQRHWFQGRDQWYISEEEADRALFSLDPRYRDQKIAEHVGHSIFSYGTNVIKMHGFPDVTGRRDLCYGVELEMEPKPRTSHEALVEALGGKYVAGRPYILCRDGSLANGGVEMITLPFTLANHKSNKYMPWDKLLAELRKVGMSGQGTQRCGMHVHINRRALSNLQLGKMLVVINAPEMQELIVTIAQRNEASYCRRFFKKVTEGGKVVGNHADALNCSNAKGTVELRIFRGNLRYERVMKNLEFADALCNYGAEQSIQKVRDPKLFYGWMKDNRSHYPNLVKFLDEEYQPTKAFARSAAKVATGKSWEQAVGFTHVEETEGDI